MGNGIVKTALPKTEEEALAAGYTKEQINEYLEQEKLSEEGVQGKMTTTTTTATTTMTTCGALLDDSPLTAVAPVASATEPSELGEDQSLADRCRALLSLSGERLVIQEKTVLEALLSREKMRKAKRRADLKKSDDNYDKSLSGTKEDTKKERDFANLLAGEEPSGPKCSIEAQFETVLRPVNARDAPSEEAYEELRRNGKWFRISDTAGGVTFFVHSLTNEESFSRPFDYVDEAAQSSSSNSAEAEGDTIKEDIYAGLESCDMEDLLGVIERVIRGTDRVNDENNDSDPPLLSLSDTGSLTSASLTPLFVDTSEDSKILTFFRYKGTVIDLQALGWSRKKQREEKVSVPKLLDLGRRLIVNAMKHGKTCCINLGSIGNDVALKDLCRDSTINVKVFERGGRRLAQTRPTFDGVKFECEDMWKQNEKVNGEIVVRDDFKIIFVTNHEPADVLRELTPDVLPIELLKPIVVRFGDGS